MYDTGKIISGIIIFLAIFTLPLWWQMGKAAPVPKPQLPTKEKHCIESKEYMRTSHMQLLDTWRNNVVRDAGRIYVGLNGKKYNMSLNNDCMACHKDKAKFCDKCHNYLGVDPYCWDCHMAPQQPKGE